MALSEFVPDGIQALFRLSAGCRPAPPARTESWAAALCETFRAVTVSMRMGAGKRQFCRRSATAAPAMSLAGG